MANRNVYDMDKQKVALVLSMGGARGIAHIGVIEELLCHNFEITSIAGSSMGAMVGAMYASGKMEECKEWLFSWDKRKMWELADLTLSRDGLVKGDRFIKELKQIIPDMNIEDLPVPYVAMATILSAIRKSGLTEGAYMKLSVRLFLSLCFSAH